MKHQHEEQFLLRGVVERRRTIAAVGVPSKDLNEDQVG